MNVVIIDDEELAIEVLERMLLIHEEVKVVGKYSDPVLALKEIDKLEVDVVFLDLEMRGLHGISLAEHLYNENPSITIVFVTAYSQYALEAFDLNAVDYLLKPVSLTRLGKTIEKLKKELAIRQNTSTLLEYNKNRLYIHTLGMYWIGHGKENIQIKWRTKKVKELFIFLLHHKEHPVHRNLIMEELWSEVFVDKGAALLHTTVYQLRKSLRDIGYENAIQYNNEQYLLDISADSDINQFFNLIRVANPNREDIKALMTLYEGDYLEQEEYPWVIYDQQKIRKDFLQCMESYIRGLTDATPKDMFLENCLIKMLQIDTYNDEYVYDLLQYYKITGNSGKFLETYDNYQRKLKEDLGLSVPFKFIKLYSNLIKGV